MRKLILFSFLLNCQTLFAQYGGVGVYKFMNLPSSSRVAALGGYLNCVVDNDPSLVLQNPSLLNPLMKKRASFSYTKDVADIGFGSAAYAMKLKNMMLAGAVQFINYGNFTRTDEFGNVYNEFGASEYAFGLSGSKTYGKFCVGSQLKFITSSMAIYNSTGLGVDAGLTYNDTAKKLTTSFVLKNMGHQITRYSQTWEPLPFEIQYGISKQPEHMPIRFSLILHNLEHFNLAYINTNKPRIRDLVTGEYIEEKIPFSEKITRHISIGTEILFSKNFNARIGYDHQRRKEMGLPNYKGGVGFSYGLGLRVSKFHISYSHSALHLAGASENFTISTSVEELFRKK